MAEELKNYTNEIINLESMFLEEKEKSEKLHKMTLTNNTKEEEVV